MVVECAGAVAWRRHGINEAALSYTATDLKRLLAYSTVENLGIFVGLGLALAFSANGMPTGCGARDDSGAVPQSRHIQEPTLPRFRRCSDGNRRARHGASGSLIHRSQLSHSSSDARQSQHCRRSTASSRSGSPPRQSSSARSCPYGA
jgi:hypothetical protein